MMRGAQELAIKSAFNSMHAMYLLKTAAIIFMLAINLPVFICPVVALSYYLFN